MFESEEERRIEDGRNSIRPDETYYDKNHPVGKLPSNSSIGKLLGEDPKDYLKPFGTHLNLTIGSYFHDLVTRPEEAALFPISDASNRNCKEYKDLQALHNDVVMKRDDALKMQALAAKTLDHPFIQTILSETGVLIEEPYVTKKHNVWWKMRQDIVVPSMKLCVDLKTSSADDFGDSCYHWGYHSQCAMYLSPHPDDWSFVFFVANKNTTDLTLYRPSEDMLLSGDQRIKDAANVYQKWEPYFNSKKI